MRPLASSWRVVLPVTISLTVWVMLVQSLNVTKGTFSFSHQVTRSVARTLSQHYELENGKDNDFSYPFQPLRIADPSPWRQKDLRHRHRRRTWLVCWAGWSIFGSQSTCRGRGCCAVVSACQNKIKGEMALKAHLSSRKMISQPPLSLRLLPSLARTKLLTIWMSQPLPSSLSSSALMTGSMPPLRITIGTLLSWAQL